MMDRPADKAKKALGLSMYKRHDIDAFVRQYGVEPGDAIWAALCRLDKVEADLDSFREIAQEFVDRRDKGEIRSTYTYNRFKKALWGE